ncbi:Beta-4C adrenergic receptor [Acropora cervicornis]|uniref:Beta-4C adrenergic receptor n=1 Tax=Acropora cervicornis TaxID=6130 RepID=A0AAD9R3E5_ACRCE|nr:Beta-4C adrenergic receptor [Acropora cervicornis]
MRATMEDTDFHYLINCILNAFLCLTASALNFITIHALRKASAFPKPLKTLLFSLAVSDVGVGFLAQPLFTALLGIAWFQGTKNNPNYDKVFSAFIPTLYLFSIASYTGVVILALDRFLAIHLHLRYRELVTQGRLLAVVILNWVFAAVFATLRLLNLRDISGGIYAFLIISGNIITPILYSKIYATAAHHANQIHLMQVNPTRQNDQHNDDLPQFVYQSFDLLLESEADSTDGRENVERDCFTMRQAGYHANSKTLSKASVRVPSTYL